MAKRLLLDALTGAIGDFVEGLSEENLKLGIWNGEVYDNKAMDIVFCRRSSQPEPTNQLNRPNQPTPPNQHKRCIL